jgi:hypothetical protein
LLDGRYRILVTLPHGVRAFDDLAGVEVELYRYDLPAPPVPPQPLIERLNDIASARNPGLCLPFGLFVDGPHCYVRVREPRGQRLDAVLAHEAPSLYTIVRRMIALCDLYLPLHQRGWALGRLGPANLVLSDEGLLQLSGFEFNPHSFSVDFHSAEPCWQAPDTIITAASDIWCLGKLLSYLLERRVREEAIDGESTGGDLRRIGPSSCLRKLRHILEGTLAVDPRARFKTVALLKARLTDVLYAHESLRQPQRAPNLWQRARHQLTPQRLRGAAWLSACCMLAVAVLWNLAALSLAARGFIGGARWVPLSRLAAVADGTMVWTEGTAQRLATVPPLDASSAEPAALGCQLVVTHELSRRSPNPLTRGYDTLRYERVAMVQTHCRPFALTAGADFVRVEPDDAIHLSEAATLRLSVAPHAAPPLQSGMLTLPLTVRPGESLRSIDVAQSWLHVGDRVCLCGRVLHREGVLTLAPPEGRPIEVLDGAMADWTAALARHCEPELVSLGTVLTLLLLCLLAPRIRYPLARPEPVRVAKAPSSSADLLRLMPWLAPCLSP